MTVASLDALRTNPAPQRTGQSAKGGHLHWIVWAYLLAVMIPAGFHVGPLALNMLRLLLIIMIIPLMLRLLMGAYGRIFITDVVFVLHVVWATVALAINNPDQVVQQMGSVGTEFLGGYVVGRAYIRTPEAFLALARALVILVCITAPLAVYETLTGRSLVIALVNSLPAINSFSPDNPMEQRLGLERVQLGFAHPIHYGLFCSIGLSLAFVGLRGQTSTLWRYLTSGIVAVCGVLALSSGALLAIALQVALILWAAVFASVRQRWWLLFGLFVMAYIVIDILSNRTPIEVFLTYGTFSAHTAYWRMIIFEWGMMNVWDNPLFGIGMNDWVRPWFMYSGSMDNFWLVMTVRYGIPGFLLLAVGYIIAVARIMRRDFSADPVLLNIRLAWVITFVGLTFTLCTVHVWTNIYSFTFFMFGAGIWMILAEPAVQEDVDATAPSLRTPPDGRNPNRNPDRAPPVPLHKTAHVYSRFPVKLRQRHDRSDSPRR